MANANDNHSQIPKKGGRQTILENDISHLNELLGESADSDSLSNEASHIPERNTDVDNRFADEIDKLLNSGSKRPTEVEGFISDDSDWPTVDEIPDPLKIEGNTDTTQKIAMPFAQPENSSKLPPAPPRTHTPNKPISGNAPKKSDGTPIPRSTTLPIKPPKPGTPEKGGFPRISSKEIPLTSNGQNEKSGFPRISSKEIPLTSGGQNEKGAFPRISSKEIPLVTDQSGRRRAGTKDLLPPPPPRTTTDSQMRPQRSQSKPVKADAQEKPAETQSSEKSIAAGKPFENVATTDIARKPVPALEPEVSTFAGTPSEIAATPNPAQKPEPTSEPEESAATDNTSESAATENTSESAVQSIDLPDEWLVSGEGPCAQETEFAKPRLLSKPYEISAPIPPASQNNIDLEKNENLPDELEDIISGYDDEIRHAKTRDGVRECTIQLAIARILEHTGHEKLAYVRYLKALEANHFSRTAIHELRRIARAYNKSKDVVTLLQSEIDTGISVEEQAILLEECGLILFFGQNRQPENAIRMLYRAIALAPKSPAPVYSLFFMLLFEKRYDESCEMLDRLVTLTDNREIQANFHVMRADIMNSQAPGTSVGLDHYLQAMELQPGWLYSYAHAVPLLIRQELWQSIYSHTIAYASHSRDKSINHAAYIFAGSIAADLLADPAASNEAYAQAIKANPSDPLALEMMIDNYNADPDQWEVLDKSLAELNQSTSVPKERMEIALMRAINLSLNGKSTSAAIDVLKAAFDEGATERLLYEYYRMLLQKEGRITEVMQVSKLLADQAPPAEAAAVFADLGCYCYDVLQKYDEAEKNFRQALSFDPAQRVAFDYLEQILRARNDFAGVAQIYRARLDIVQDAKARASILYTLATLCEYCLGQPANAIVYYKQYREIYPDDPHAIHNIARISTRTGDWKTVIEMLLIEKNASSSQLERCNLLLRIANVCRYKLNKINYAINFLIQAKDEYPSSPAVFKDLEDILQSEKRWKELIAVYSEKLNFQKKNTDRIVTLGNMANIYENMICDNNAAVACYEKILSLDPDNLAARTQLSNIYRRTKNVAAFYELSLAHAEHIQLPQHRAKHLYRVALKTLTLFQDREQAITILESSLANDPYYTPAVFLLSMLYGATGRADTLVEVLRNYTNATKAQHTKSSTSLMIAYLLFWSFRRKDEAIHPLELSLALMPENISARAMLILTQYQRGQYGELGSLIAEGAQYLNDPQYAIHNYNFAAFLSHTFASMANGALESELTSLRATLNLDPDNLIANERLEAMEPSRVNLVPFLEKRLRHASRDDRTEIQLAIVESIFPEQPQKAFSIICDIVNENSSHLPAIRVAANLALRLNNPKLLCRFYALQAQNLENIAMQVITWTDAARIARDRLNDSELAIEYFKQAFMLAPHRMDLTDQLMSLLIQKHDKSAIDSMMSIHLRSISKENQVMRYQQMADYYLNDFNEPAQAATKLHQALEIDQDNPDLLWKLAQLEYSRQHWNEAGETLDQMLEKIPDETEQKAQARMMLIELCIKHFHDTRRAMPLLQFILSKDPDNTVAIQHLADAYFSDGRLNEALELLLRLKDRIEPPDNLRILLQIADIYRVLNDDKLTATIHEAAKVARRAPESLADIQSWFDRFNDPSTMLSFLEKLVEMDDGIPIESRVSVYEFATSCYDGPLHMRFEADKYALEAASLAPASFRAQMLAAKVFDHKEAIIHAHAAEQLAPFSAEPYKAMLNIALNTANIDMQARIEQQLVALATDCQPTASLQEQYLKRYPTESGILDESVILSMAPADFNPRIQGLLKVAGPKAQVFALPEIPSEPVSSDPQIAAMVDEIASVFGMSNVDIRLSKRPSFIYTASPESTQTVIFNLNALMAASEAEKRFYIASALTHIKLGTLALVILPPDNLAMILTGLLGLVESKLANPDVLKRMQSFLPRATKKAVTEYITSNGLETFNCDPARMQRAARVLDIEMGHLFSADLSASVAAMFRSRKPDVAVPTTPQQCMLNYPNLPFIKSLFAFNSSEQFEELRQRLGLYLRGI